MCYNLGRMHQSLRITPPMAANGSDPAWALEESAALAAQFTRVSP